jgi:hypothetical protein
MPFNQADRFSDAVFETDQVSQLPSPRSHGGTVCLCKSRGQSLDR